MQEYREYLKYNLKYAGIWNIMEYNAHIPNIVDDFASDGPLDKYHTTVRSLTLYMH